MSNGQGNVQKHNHIKRIKIQLFHLLKCDLSKLKKITITEGVFIKLFIPRLMDDTAYLAVTYGQRVHSYLDASEGSILNVHVSGGFLV